MKIDRHGGIEAIAIAAQESSVHQSSARRRNRATQFGCSFNPLANHDFRIGERFLISRAVSGTAGELGHLGDENVVFAAPVQDNLKLDPFGHFGFSLRPLAQPLSQGRRLRNSDTSSDTSSSEQ